MIRRTAACLLSLALPLPALPVFIGTNTGKNTSSKGIYYADFDPEFGKLTEPKLAAEYSNPGFLAQHPRKPVLLCIGAPKQPYADGSSSVAAFSIGKDHELKFLGEASTEGKGACHLVVDATGSTVAVASYGDGRISTLRLDENGVPLKTVSLISNTGSGPNKNRQNGPHAHGVYFDKANTHLFVPDLGLDKVLVYPFDAATSKLGDAMIPLATAPGAGPRHMAFSPDEKHAYVLNELDCTILVASHEAGRLTAIGPVQMMLEPHSSLTSAEIEVSEDGNFVYASVRDKSTPPANGNELWVFKRDSSTGKLAFVEKVNCGGKIPRHFKIAPGGKWLLCGHQDSSTISVLPRDPATGKLGVPTSTVSSPSPICILFAR